MTRIEVGKTYVTRDGSLTVQIEAETSERGTYRMQGMDNRGRITWCSSKGRFLSKGPSRLDLVTEA